ncbi:hypothetical protein UlMin_041005 [Ulmus minor]
MRKPNLARNLIRFCSSSFFRRFSYQPSLPPLDKPSRLNPSSSPPPLLGFRFKPTSLIPSSATFRNLTTKSEEDNEDCPFQGEVNDEGESSDVWEEGETTDGWEDEEEVTEPKIGDGGDGGGVVLQGVAWGERVHTIALEVLSMFDDDMKLFAFKTTPRGYIYVRLDKLSNEYGCPGIEELEKYNKEYKKRLDEVGALGEIPSDLALEISSPGAERLLKVPDDLDRFKDMPMRVCYNEEVESKCLEKNGVYVLESIETEECVWKLANVKENRDPLGKGRPLSRKQKDWRLKLPFLTHKRVSLYLDY